MSSKKSKKKINGGDIIKNMFGGTDIKDLEAKVWIIIILVGIILLTIIIVYITPHIVKIFDKKQTTTTEQIDISQALETLFSHFKDKSLENFKAEICATVNSN